MKTIVKNEVGAVEDVISLDKPRLLYLYTVYDIQAEDSAPPFCAVNDAIARRQVVRMLKDVDFPDDYKLYKVGMYDPGLPAILDVMMEPIEFKLDLINYKEYLRNNKTLNKKEITQ